MAVPEYRGPQIEKNYRLPLSAGVVCLALIAVFALRASADEIRLKDGKKLYGVIVAYEDNMFKVKTDFGFVLVEKDKIAAIIPTTPTGPKAEAKAGAKLDPNAELSKPEHGPGKKEVAAEAAPAAEKTAVRSTPPAKEDVASKSYELKPPKAETATAAIVKKPEIGAPKSEAATAAVATAPAAPKEPEPPANVEKVSGNEYINVTHKFRMYKAPSWNLIEDARQALPNAIVAMGTLDESTLLIIGQEKAKEAFAPAAATVERRLRDVYGNYRQLSQEKTKVGGLPAIEYQYRGEADGHDWSGTLVVISRNGEIFTVLGMTYADTDLIQIQENVIARAISSLDFNAQIN